MAKSSVPKYTIRLALVWLLPIGSLLSGSGLWFPWLLAALLTPVEVPKARQWMFSSKLRKQLPVFKVPALLRLAVLWMLQVWWVIMWRAGGGSGGAAEQGAAAKAALLAEVDPDAGLAEGDVAAGGSDGSEAAEEDLAWAPRSMSVVLPCAGEGQFALNTVRSIWESTPERALREIIVVDDGSQPPLTEGVLGKHAQEKYRVRVIRHESTVGLIGAKKDGGDAASGDVVVFFDCHVAPQPGWHDSFLRLIAENYRRIVVPTITDLDVTSWRQKGGSASQSKCYLTWDADFKWLNSADRYVPVISGGLLAISKRWWTETGGYDAGMAGWGGENLDQSLRSWLCGGEIMLAEDAQVAHMWRTADDPRTKANYQVPAGAAVANRVRAATAWFGDFAEKLHQFPALEVDRKAEAGGPWYGSPDSILSVKRRLNCRSFAWFMHRFRNVYEDAGLVPSEIFHLKSSMNGKCLTYTGHAGTSPDGKGSAELRPCDGKDERQRWHGANRDTTQPEQACCSGLRAWNTDQCLRGADSDATGKGHARTFVCDISGDDKNQAWALDSEGQLRKRGAKGFMSSSCLEADSQGSVKVLLCRRNGASPQWSKLWPSEPVETRLYRQALENGEAG